MAAKTTVPNQRFIYLHKEVCDKSHLYSINNLAALDEAAGRLQSKGGFKLYMYLAKNNANKMPSFALSSADFMAWSGLAYTAYTTAFQELVDEKYLVLKEGTKNTYIFYDKSQAEDENIIIEIPEQKIKEIEAAERAINSGFVF